MSLPADEPVPSNREDARRLAPILAGIVLVEAVTIALLYWFGRHFS